MTCTTVNCNRHAEPGYAVCAACIRSLLAGAFGEPEWVRRMRIKGLPAKDLTSHVLDSPMGAERGVPPTFGVLRGAVAPLAA